jgi:predicted kinase
MTAHVSLYVLIGIQGAGKSRWARQNAERLNAVVVSSDEIRNEIEADGSDAAGQGDRVFAILEARVGALLARGINVIADATHARRAWRSNLLRVAGEQGARRVAIWFDVPLPLAQERNSQRPGGGWGERRVPEEVLLGVWRGFEPPVPGEFDDIVRLTA